MLALAVPIGLLIGLSLGALSGKPDNPDSSQEPILSFAPRFVCACPRALKVLVTASVVGLLTGFFGVGGGFAVVPALVLALGFTMPVAVGTSLLVIAINSASALVSRLGQGVQLDWKLIGIFTAAAITGSLLGGRVTSRVPPPAALAGLRPAARCRRPLHGCAQHPPAALNPIAPLVPGLGTDGPTRPIPVGGRR